MTAHGQVAEYGIKIEGPIDGDYGDLITKALEAAFVAVDQVFEGSDLRARWRSYRPPWVFEEGAT